jgi:hypothetical protein
MKAFFIEAVKKKSNQIAKTMTVLVRILEVTALSDNKSINVYSLTSYRANAVIFLCRFMVLS